MPSFTAIEGVLNAAIAQRPQGESESNAAARLLFRIICAFYFTGSSPWKDLDFPFDLDADPSPESAPLHPTSPPLSFSPEKHRGTTRPRSPPKPSPVSPHVRSSPVPSSVAVTKKVRDASPPRNPFSLPAFLPSKSTNPFSPSSSSVPPTSAVSTSRPPAAPPTPPACARPTPPSPAPVPVPVPVFTIPPSISLPAPASSPDRRPPPLSCGDLGLPRAPSGTTPARDKIRPGWLRGAVVYRVRTDNRWYVGSRAPCESDGIFVSV